MMYAPWFDSPFLGLLYLLYLVGKSIWVNGCLGVWGHYTLLKLKARGWKMNSQKVVLTNGGSIVGILGGNQLKI